MLNPAWTRRRFRTVFARFAIVAILFGPLFQPAATALPRDEPVKPTAGPDGQRLIERPNVTVRFAGLATEYAEAVATIAESAYAHFREQYHFDMPDRLFVEVSVDRENLTGIWIADDHTIRIAYRAERELEPPHRSNVDTIYGLTYRIADLGRERTLGPAPWLKEDATRGLSHLCACRMMDALYVTHGTRLWPEPYDYVDTGWRALRRKIERRNAPAIIRAAAEWHALERDFAPSLIGDTLATWRRAKISMRRPEDQLLNAIAGRTVDSHERSKLRRWFRGFEDNCVWSDGERASYEKSFSSGDLAREAKVLQYDDGGSDGAQALSAGGHITTFQTPADQWYLKEVQFHAKRYGSVPRGGKDFVITVYDERFKPIATWRKPYGLLRGTDADWHRIPVPITRLPEKFVVLLEFGSGKNVGVQVSADTASNGHSASGGLRGGITPLDKADWMIRVEVDRRKHDNPLKYRPD